MMGDNIPKAPAKETSEPSAFARMKDFTRRLIVVPKSEVAKDTRKQHEPEQ
jgi:hypothetical protein